MNNAEVKKGDTVRVRDPGQFGGAYAKRVSNRDAVVLWADPDRHGHCGVTFQKRNGRGKEFTWAMPIRDLVLVAPVTEPALNLPRVRGQDETTTDEGAQHD